MAPLVKLAYGYTCWLCGGQIDDSEYSVDHVVPRSKGGDVWDIDNMRPAHLRCNKSRGNRAPKPITPKPKQSRAW